MFIKWFFKIIIVIFFFHFLKLVIDLIRKRFTYVILYVTWLLRIYFCKRGCVQIHYNGFLIRNTVIFTFFLNTRLTKNILICLFIVHANVKLYIPITITIIKVLSKLLYLLCRNLSKFLKYCEIFIRRVFLLLAYR